MEKKLTDEEIVKAYEHCIVKEGRCTDCILVDGDKICISCEDILELIQRQKAEIEELREDNEQWETLYHIGEERKYRKMFVEEWKKEYQKELDKQGNGLIAGSPDFDYVYELYFKQKAEIERLTEELANLNWYKMWHNKFKNEIEALTLELETYRPTKLSGNGQCKCSNCGVVSWTDWFSRYKGQTLCDECLKEQYGVEVE